MIQDGRIQRLSDLNGGDAEIQFRTALGQVIENLNDQKCDGKTARKISMVVSFHPDPRTQTLQIEIETSTKLAKRANRCTTVFMGKGADGQLGLFNDDPQQTKMFADLQKDMSQKGAE
jgi:hypothetical protein